MAFADSALNLRTAGISAVRLKRVGDDAYYDVGAIRDGVMEFTTKQKPDSKKREFPYDAIDTVLKFKAKYTSVANMIKLLDSFIGGDVHFVATLVGEAVTNTVSSQNIDASTGWFGNSWRLVCEGDSEEERYIEFTFDRAISAANYLLMLDAAPAVGTPNATDAFYNMGSLVVGDVRNGAIVKVEFSGSYADVLTNIANASFIAESTIMKKDSQGRSRTSGIDLKVSFDCLQASATERELLDNLMAQQTDYRLTLADGAVVTLASKLGITWKYNNASDMGDLSSITIAGSGAIIPASWDAIWP